MPGVLPVVIVVVLGNDVPRLGWTKTWNNRIVGCHVISNLQNGQTSQWFEHILCDLLDFIVSKISVGKQ
jgi:hypothetical protein